MKFTLPVLRPLTESAMKDLVGRRSYLHDPALHNRVVRVGKQLLEAWNSPYT